MIFPKEIFLLIHNLTEKKQNIFMKIMDQNSLACQNIKIIVTLKFLIMFKIGNIYRHLPMPFSVKAQP